MSQPDGVEEVEAVTEIEVVEVVEVSIPIRPPNKHAKECGHYRKGRCFHPQRSSKGHVVDDSKGSEFFCGECKSGKIKSPELNITSSSIKSKDESKAAKEATQKTLS